MNPMRMRSSPRVKSGRQYWCERSRPSPSNHNSPRSFPEIYRKHPGYGYRHVLMMRHVREFLTILPQWSELSIGLNVILLAPARPGCDGFHRPGLVGICAQPRNLSQLVSLDYAREHREIFDRLGVPIERTMEGPVLHFTQQTLRAYQLLHIFLHELGHHHDRMTTRSQRRPSRGEGFAEMYARTRGEEIWSRYFEMILKQKA